MIKSIDIPIEKRSRDKALIFKLLPDNIPGMEIDRFELSAGCRMKGIPHMPQTKEYLTVNKGKIDVIVDGEKHQVSKDYFE